MKQRALGAVGLVAIMLTGASAQAEPLTATHIRTIYAAAAPVDAPLPGALTAALPEAPSTRPRGGGPVVYDSWSAATTSAGFSNIYFDDCACYTDPNCAGGNVRFLKLGNVTGGIWQAEPTASGAPGDIVWDDYAAANWPLDPADEARLTELIVTVVINNNLAGVAPDPDRLYALLVNFVDAGGAERAAFTTTFSVAGNLSGVFQLVIDASSIDPPAMIPSSGRIGFDFLNTTFDATTLAPLANSTQGVGIAHAGGDNVLAGCPLPASLQTLGASIGDQWSIASSAAAGQLTFNANLFNIAPRENKRFGAPTRWYAANLPVRISVNAVIECPGAASCGCDVNSDCRIDLTDLAGVLAAFGAGPGDPQYDPSANCATASSAIGLDDLALLLADFGNDCSVP